MTISFYSFIMNHNKLLFNYVLVGPLVFCVLVYHIVVVATGDTIQQIVISDSSNTEGFVEGIERIGSDVPVTGDNGQ